MDTPTPCANCLHFAPALEPGYCSHPSEATFPTAQQLDELATAGQPIPPCPGFTPTAPTPVRFARNLTTWKVSQLSAGQSIPEGWEPATAAQYQEYKEAMEWEAWEQDQETGYY